MVSPEDQQVDALMLRQRQDMYLANHYTTAHITVVSVALGVAGISAASLLSSSPPFAEVHALLAVLWIVSLLATTVAFAGAMIGSITLPPRVPAVVDLGPPLLLALCEFLLFSILAYQVTGLSSPRALLIGWWFTFGAYGMLAAGQVWRVHHLVDPRTFARFRPRLRDDIWKAAGTGVFGTVIGTIHALTPRLPQALEFAFAALAGLAMVVALTSHSLSASQLRTDLGRR